MRVIWTRRLVDLLVAIFVLALVVLFVRTAGTVSDGNFDLVSWYASTGQPNTAVLDEGGVEFALTSGHLVVGDQMLANSLKFAARLLGLGLGIAVLWQLRGFLTRVAQGDVFAPVNTVALRKIGWMLLAICAVSVLSTMAVQSMIVGAIPPLDGQVVHPSISWDVQGVENIWLEYEPPIMTLLLSLIAFICAGAVQSGQEYREDSESVI